MQIRELTGKNNLLVFGGIVAVFVALWGAKALLLDKPAGRPASTADILDIGAPAGGQALDAEVYLAPEQPLPRGLNIIFFADGYSSRQDFAGAVAVLQKMFSDIRPWSGYKRFNFYQIFPRETDICAVKTADERKPVLRCDADKINKYLNALQTGPFKLVVLSRQTFQSWANVSRLNDSGIFFSMPQTPQTSTDAAANEWLFAHLAGHAFGLKDEEMIVLAKNGSAVFVPDGPNCAPDRATAEKWWGDLVGKEPGVGYYKGCSANPDYIKPTEGSLMNFNDLAKFTPTYGAVSERYLQKILNYCFAEERPAAETDPAFFAQYPEFRACLK